MLNKLKALLASFKAEIKDTWERSKMYILGILAIIVALEFRKLKEYLTAKAAQQEMKKDKKDDANLAGKENAANAQAAALIADANNLPNQQPPIGDDWNSK